MSYQRFKKGGRVAKSPFLAKSVQKSLNKNMKTDFFQKTTFFESPIAQSAGEEVLTKAIHLILKQSLIHYFYYYSTR